MVNSNGNPHHSAPESPHCGCAHTNILIAGVATFSTNTFLIWISLSLDLGKLLDKQDSGGDKRSKWYWGPFPRLA